MSGIRSTIDNTFECELTDEEMDQLEKFLEDNDCYECEHCGWQTHPGEGCDCDEYDPECSECGCKQEECTCE